MKSIIAATSRRTASPVAETASGLQQEREAWIARAVAAGMTEADACTTAGKMQAFTAAPAKKRAPRNAAPPAPPSTPRPARKKPPAGALAVVAPAAEVVDAAQMALPGFHDDLRAIPNHLARSPLFAPIKPGRRAICADERLPSPEGVTVHYSGPQLDQADCDVFMQLVYEQRGRAVGSHVTVHRRGFLQAIGRADGGKNYEWLQAVLDRLQSARVRVENSRYKLTAQLIGKVIEDKREATFQVVLDPDIIEMFAPGTRSLIDWQKRLMLARRVDLAKWLHNFTASHGDHLQHHSLTNLRAWSGYSSPPRKFREAIAEALAELARVEVIAAPDFYERKNPGTKKAEQMVKWIRL